MLLYAPHRLRSQIAPLAKTPLWKRLLAMDVRDLPPETDKLGDALRARVSDPMVALDGGGESLAGLAARVHGALEEIAARHAGETVVVVTHGGVLDIAHRLATGKPLEGARDFAIPNAALNWIEHTAGSWRLLAWADESHLTDALDELLGS